MSSIVCNACKQYSIECYTFEAKDGLVIVCIKKRIAIRSSGSKIRLYIPNFLNKDGVDIRLLPGGCFNQSPTRNQSSRDEKDFRVEDYKKSINIYDKYNNNNNPMLSFALRGQYVEKFAWGVVDNGVVSFIAKHVQGIALEIGAGKGWLACNMRALMGNDVWIATDGMCSHNINENTKKWTSVIHMNAADSVEKFPEANCLVIMWPACEASYAYNALQKFLERINEDSRIIFWGENKGGCTANDDFFDLLDGNFVLDEENIYYPYQWYGFHDYIRVYYPILG